MKFTLRVAIYLLAPALLVFAGMGALRWMALGDEERAAIDWLRTVPTASPEDNGHSWLAFSGHEVPQDRLAALTAADVGRFVAWEQDLVEDAVDHWGFAYTGLQGLPDAAFPEAEAVAYPRRADWRVPSTFCAPQAGDCLMRVVAAPDAVRAELATQTGRLEAAEQALSAREFGDPYPPSMFSPLPPMQLLRLPLTRAALIAVDGHVAEAMRRSCGQLADSRRLAAGSNMLVHKMVLLGHAQGAAALLLDLRRAHPDQPLPADCTPALAPVVPEHYLACETLRREAAWQARLWLKLQGEMTGKPFPAQVLFRHFLQDAELLEAWLGMSYAGYCTEDFRRAAMSGAPLAAPAPAVALDDPRCLLASLSCRLLADSLAMHDIKYQERMQQLSAKLQLLLAAHELAAGAITVDALLARGISGHTLALTGPRRIRLESGSDVREPLVFELELVLAAD
jgi:hypothetical protein